MDLARLTELLKYDAETGVITWRVNRRGYRGIRAGDIAGTVHPSSRDPTYKSIRLMVDQKWHEAHRVAWALFHMQVPPEDMLIDHLSGDATDNRMVNLRLASRKQNMENQKLHRKNKSGYRGVSWSPTKNRWIAMMGNGGKQKNLGLFVKKEDAVAALLTARSILYTHYTGRDLK
jgi:hypothetical protein